MKMPSSGVSFFRKGKSMWNAKKPEVSLTPREQFTIEDQSMQEMLPLNRPCQGVRIEVHRVIVGPKPWPPLLRSLLKFSTYTDFCESYFCSCFFCFWFLAIIGCYILILCVNLGYREPYTELQGVTLRNFNLSRTKTAWELDSDLVVVFKAGNPSKIAGFTTRFFHTEVEASYHDNALSLGNNYSIPPFTQRRKSGRNLTAEVQSNHHQLDEASGLVLQAEMQNNSCIRDVRINVNAHAKQKYLARTLDRWFNFTCLVDMTVPSASEPGHLLRKSCTQTSTEPQFIGYLCAPFMCMDF